MVKFTEQNDLKVSSFVWTVLEKNDSTFVVSVVNIGKSKSEIRVNVDGYNKFNMTSLLNGQNLSENFAIEPNGVKIFEISL